MAERIARPGGWTRRFFTDATPYDLGIAVCGFLYAMQAALQAWDAGRLTAAGSAAVAAFGIFSLTAVKLGVTFWQKELRRSPHLLESSLHALHAVLELLDETESDRDCGLRVTVHVPVGDGVMFEQVIDYVGDQRDGKRTAGRRFPSRAGILAWVLREKEALASWRENENYSAYLDEMVNGWGYTRAEAEALHPGTMSWMAVPLFGDPANPSAVTAVVYLDSTDPAYFTDLRRMFTTSACTGIAQYIRKVYSN